MTDETYNAIITAAQGATIDLTDKSTMFGFDTAAQARSFYRYVRGLGVYARIDGATVYVYEA